jgi:ABC-type branched-subunit amino acid transport system substrate-binding protein
MGIIKKIFVVFLLLSVFVLSGQTASDTVFFDGDIYVKHIVKAGESLKSIAKLHKVKTADIIDNNEIQKRLYYNQLLYIPIFYNELENKSNFSLLSIQKQIENSSELKDTSVLHIALLMPYFLIKNDTMFDDFEDITGIPSIYYKGSEVALSFHVGVEIALDSIRKQGKNICLHTFDTNRDTLKVYQIIHSKALENMDIIIGPLYANNFKILCKKYGNDSTKILISPLSKNTENVKKYKAVYQLSPSFQVQENIIMQYVLKYHKEDRVIVLNEKGSESKSAYIKNLFYQQGKIIETFTVKDTKLESIRRVFKQKQVVIIPSENKAFVSKILGSVGGMDSISFVFGLYDWKKYNNLDIHNLMFLDVKFPNPYSFSNYSNDDISFVQLFEKMYNTNQSKYTHIAYNVIMHFCSDFSLFKFQNIKQGGRVNTYAPLYHYVDYVLVPVE